ncbi:hypothetical protein [Pseudonocardia sediminis]|nr:hypothetical protein [Pseudonocardia sediminis]
MVTMSGPRGYRTIPVVRAPERVPYTPRPIDLFAIIGVLLIVFALLRLTQLV